MKSLLLLAGMLLVLDVQAQANFDGNKLLEACRAAETPTGSFMGGVCGGYVSALVDVMSGPPVALRVCLPDGVTRGQAREIVMKALRDHPEQLHHSASDLVMGALSKAFPCK
jgi:hypothetical protein